MKTFVVFLFCLELFVAAISTQHYHTGYHQVHNKGKGEKPPGQAYRDGGKKWRGRFHRRLHKQMQSTLAASNELEQNVLLENISPEYKYEDKVENTDHSNVKIANLLDESTIQELASKNLLVDETQQSTKHGLMNGVASIGNRPGADSLEHFNVVLENTSPEYQYDGSERDHGLSYDTCKDLDADCWKYEMDGLCSDSPDLAEKRFNCKKTCHLCISLTGARRQQHKKAQNKH